MASNFAALHLEQFRRQAGVPLEAIANNTKISTRFLRAIESEEFDKLPGGVFNTSYIRQYAAAIGFEEEKLLAHYYAKTEPPPEVEPEKTAESGSGKATGLKSYFSWLRNPSLILRY
ncbi:MAG: helix-turn-helix domain-containing protein [Bryobacteraceae bacterium]